MASDYPKMADGCCHKTVITRCSDCSMPSLNEAPGQTTPSLKFKAEVDHKTVEYEPWHPMKDPVDVKTIGKALEETGELASVLARCLIQGINEKEPQTGKVNKTWLEEEIADVWAGVELLQERFSLDVAFMQQRKETKKKRLREWHEMA